MIFEFMNKILQLKTNYFISYLINNDRMSDSTNKNQLNKEFKRIKEEEEKKKKLLTEVKQPENPLPVGEGHETEVIDKEE